MPPAARAAVTERQTQRRPRQTGLVWSMRIHAVLAGPVAITKLVAEQPRQQLRLVTVLLLMQLQSVVPVEVVNIPVDPEVQFL